MYSRFKLRDSFAQHRLLGGALVLALTQLAASLMGLVRDRALTVTFPGLQTVDVYLASFRPSDLLFQITIMAGLSTVLVPLLSCYKVRNKPEEMSRLLSSVLFLGSSVFGAIALFLAIIFPLIAPSLTLFRGPELDLYITFGRLALLTNFLFVAGNAVGQYLITEQRYWIYGITPVLYTLGTIAGTLFLTPYVGAYGPMLGTLSGAIVYVFLRIGGALVRGFRFRAVLWHQDLLKMGWLMVPRMVALGALQLELLLFDRIASGLPDGAVTINAYARNFQSVVVGVVGIALAQSAFSALSQSASAGEWQRYRVYLKKGIGMLVLLTIPAAIALALLAPVAAWLVHLQSVLPVFGIALMLYAISIPFESLNHLLLRSYYALHSTAIPAVMNVLNGTVAIALSWMLAPRYGVFALAIAFSVGQLLQAGGLGLLLPWRLKRKEGVNLV